MGTSIKNKLKVALLLVVLIVCTALLCFALWKRGTPYGDPRWSPNRQYYVQKYLNLTASRFVATMPGQGSDAEGGYIRLHRADGAVIAEHFVPFFREVQPIWDGKKVYLMGVPELDENPWVAPSSTE